MSDIIDLIELLSSKTAEGKLRWELDGDARITTQQGNSIVDVDFISNNVGRITIRNLDGIVLEQRSVAPAGRDGNVLWEMFKRVKRDALGVDKALEDLRSTLLRL